MERWSNSDADGVTPDVSVIKTAGCGEIHLVNMKGVYSAVVRCLNEKMDPFIGHSTIFDVYVGNVKLVHILPKDAEKNELPDAIKRLSLEKCSHWVDVEFIDGEMKGFHAYALGSNAKKRTRAANIAAAVTVALQFGLKPTEYWEATNFNQFMKNESWPDSVVVFRTSDDGIM